MGSYTYVLFTGLFRVRVCGCISLHEMPAPCIANEMSSLENGCSLRQGDRICNRTFTKLQTEHFNSKLKEKNVNLCGLETGKVLSEGHTSCHEIFPSRDYMGFKGFTCYLINVLSMVMCNIIFSLHGGFFKKYLFKCTFNLLSWYQNMNRILMC